MRMSSTFGAPAGALVSRIVPGLESSYVRPIFASVKSCSGLGNAFGLPVGNICGDCRTQAAPATIETSRSEATVRLMQLPFLRPFLRWKSAGDVQRARVGGRNGQDSPSRTTFQSERDSGGACRGQVSARVTGSRGSGPLPFALCEPDRAAERRPNP